MQRKMLIQCWFWGMLIVAGWILTVSIRPVYACTPPPDGLPYYTVADRVRAAEVVLEGTVTDVITGTIPGDTATVEVHQYFKGTGPDTVTIRGFGPSSACLSTVYQNDRLIFYTRGNPHTELEANYLSQFDAVDPATPEVINLVIAAVERKSTIYLPLITATTLSAGQSHSWVAATPVEETTTPASGANAGYCTLGLMIVTLSMVGGYRLR